MEPFTVFASTWASSWAGSSAVTEPLNVLAETPPVSPNASIRTRTSPFIDSTFTGPLAVATSTSPLIVWITRGPRAPVTCTSPTMVVAPRLALRGSRTVKSTATSLWRLLRISISPCPGAQPLSRSHTAQMAMPPSSDTASVRLVAVPYDGGIAICAVWDRDSGCAPGHGDIEMRSRRHNDVAVDFTVRLPRSASLGATTMVGDVHVAGARGPLVIHTM